MRRSRTLIKRVAPITALAVVALPACGRSGGDTNNLSKGQFAAKANELCSKADADRAQLLQQLPPMPSGSTDGQTLQNAAAIDRDLLRKVDALVPPESEQDNVDRLLETWRQRADAEDQYAIAVGSMQDPQTLATFTANIAQIDATAAPIANQVGVTQCARAPS